MVVWSYGLPVSGGYHLSENLVGAHFPEYESSLVLSHFKGHQINVDGSKTDAHALCGPHARARPRHDSIKGPSCGGSSRRSFLKALTVAGSRIRHCTAKTAMTTYEVLASELT